jgi:hypothetical protein
MGVVYGMTRPDWIIVITVKSFKAWGRDHTERRLWENYLMSDFLYDYLGDDCCPDPGTNEALEQHLATMHQGMLPQLLEGARIAWLEYVKYVLTATACQAEVPVRWYGSVKDWGSRHAARNNEGWRE